MRLPSFLSLLVLVLSIFYSVVQASQSFQVLVVHAYSQKYAWTTSQHRGFEDELSKNSSKPINITTEYLDTKRRAYSPIYAKQFTRYIREKYRGYTPDVIYVTANSIQKHRLSSLALMTTGLSKELNPCLFGVFLKKRIFQRTSI